MSFLRQRLTPVHLLLVVLSLLLSPTTSTELDQLLKLKASLEPSNPTLFTSWNQQTPTCNFTGIVCNSNGLVSEINLSEQKLHGSLPFDVICALPQLEKLSFGSNFLHGSLTDDLKSCTSLHELDLGKNSFSGEVPELSSLSQLRVLSLNSSGVSGLFPWKSLENLTELRFLSLGDNRFDESPITMELPKLDKLYWLYVSNCSITGEIPDGIGNLTLLENLELADNHMVGEIPRSITNLKKLWQLELYGNSLTGKIPVGFGNLTSLRNFDASTNKLEGDLSELKSLTGLVSLHLFENQLVGSIPEEFGEFTSLVELSLYTNKLTGSLPQKLGSWSGMEIIDVSENYLTGPIPPGMCKNERMVDFLLLQNNFTGGIPESYVNCTSLVRLRVNNNSLSGTVPAGIWSLPNVTIIDLSMNQFEGPLAPDVGKANSLSLLWLANNRFSGELPAALSEATSLVTIQLSVNQFEGQIPETIGNLKKLGSLHLEQNMLSGAIPDSLGSCVGISEINLAHNILSGQIPPSLGSLPNLNSLNLSRNQLSSEVPATLSSLKLSLLDLTNNHLIGRVPESLSIAAFNESFDGNPGLCSQTMKNLRPCSSHPGSPSHPRIFLSSFIAGVLVLLILLGVFLLWKLRRSSLDDQPSKSNSWTMKQYHLLSFTENEILDSIKAENLIGRGGSGNVYKVQLRDGKALAVKHIWTSPDSASQKSYRSTASMLKKSKSNSSEYDAEVATLSSLRHVNVVKLYCSISSEDSNLLVYEYFPNGSLWDQLHMNKKVKMGWEVRYGIALGAAKGLEYLHHGSHRPVIHRDVKSSNILLDGEWKPRIADFGLAKIVQAGGEMTRVIAGTYGYIAPEYAYTYKVNEKSDVYSFGVVLMELVTGKRPVEPEFGENKDIVSWVYRKMQGKDTELELVDSSIEEALQEDALNVLSIAIRCTARVPVLRPSMRMVVQMLEEAQPCELTSISITKEGEVDNPKMEQNFHY